MSNSFDERELSDAELENISGGIIVGGHHRHGGFGGYYGEGFGYGGGINLGLGLGLGFGQPTFIEQQPVVFVEPTTVQTVQQGSSQTFQIVGSGC